MGGWGGGGGVKQCSAKESNVGNAQKGTTSGFILL